MSDPLIPITTQDETGVPQYEIELPEYEVFVKEAIFPELEQGRPNWDQPHTEVVVMHIKSIINENPQLPLDPVVLIIAAYAHDWGYAGLFYNGQILSSEDIQEVKDLHMEIGAEKLSLLLENPVFNFLSLEQKQRAVHLVLNHDRLEALTELDELILMEADTLAGLDVEKVTPTFNQASNQRYMATALNKRFPLFITEFGKKEFERLYQSRSNYYASLTS